MITRISIALILNFFVSFAFAESAREYFKYAKYSYDSKEYDKALKFINSAIDVDPIYVNGFLLRAEINFGLQEFEKVIEDITIAFQIDNNKINSIPEFYLLRSNAYINLNKFNKAIVDLDKCLKINPSNARALFLKGVANFEMSDFYNALENIDGAIKLDADESEYYFKRAVVKKVFFKPIPGSKTFETMMADVKISIALNPGNYQYYKLKCELLKQDPNYKQEELISELSGIIDRFPQRADFYAERGLALVLNYKFNSAIKDFSKAIALDDQNESNYRNRGLCFHNTNKYNRAIEDYTSSIELLIKKLKTDKNKKSVKKVLAQTFNMRGMTNQLNRNEGHACDDYYNAAKLGSKTGLNNYRKNCNVFN